MRFRTGNLPTIDRAKQIQVLAGAIATTFLLASLAAFARFSEIQARPQLASATVGADVDRLTEAAEAPEPEPSTTTAPPPPAAPEPERPAEVKGRVVTRSQDDGPRTALLPTGKGMWFHHLSQAGPLDQVVAHAKASGLTHLYVRTGSSKSGFYAAADLDRILPVAHAAGLKVVGWDFPYLEDPAADARRSLQAIRHTTPDGHRIDAFSADIETQSEGVRLAADRVDAFGRALRQMVGPDYPLIGTVPNACLARTFPFAEVARHFDAIAPMVYWITRDPAEDVACNLEKLAPLGRPVLPIGQAYDPAIDNPTLVGLVPRYEHLAAFMRSAADHGAAGVSFWAWHTATAEMWQAVADSPDFTLTPMRQGHGDPAQVLVLQRLLYAYGFDLPLDGRYDGATATALAAVQAGLGLEPTGRLDEATIARLVGPR